MVLAISCFYILLLSQHHAGLLGDISFVFGLGEISNLMEEYYEKHTKLH